MSLLLAAFVGREIEFEPVALTPVDVAGLFGLCQYLIVNGPVIKDGETVGLTEKEKIRIRYAPSGRHGPGPVMVLTLETEDPAALGQPVGHRPNQVEFLRTHKEEKLMAAVPKV